MGYLTDNIPPGKNHAICQDLYIFRMIVTPGFKTDLQLSALIMDVLPDVEEWQFSGRRRCPIIPGRGKARGVRRQIHPAAYAQNSRRMRPFTEEVHYAFHTELQRSQVAARFDVEGIKYKLMDEPTPSTAAQPVVIVLP